MKYLYSFIHLIFLAFIIFFAPSTIFAQTAPTRLGGMNLDGYCRSQNQGGSTLANNNWTCESGAAIDLTNACQWQYPNQNATASQDTPGNPFTWSCYTNSGSTTTPTPQTEPTPALTPAPAQTRLGGMNLDGYCRSQNQGGSTLANDNWTCESGAAIELTNACRWQYTSNTAIAIQETQGNPFTWACYTSGSGTTPTTAPTPAPTAVTNPTSTPTVVPTPATNARARRNIYDLTPVELQRLVNAFNTIRANGVYADFMQRHMQTMMTETPFNDPTTDRNAAHRGPSFLPWHRAAVWEFEEALRSVDPTINLPYWAFENESLGSTPLVLSAAYFGSDGNPAEGDRVTDGPFASWGIVRRIGRAAEGQSALPNSLDVARIMQITNYDSPPYDETSNGFRSAIEGWTGTNAPWGMHNRVHAYIGGDMLAENMNTNVVNDPIFWLVHANVDRLWWRWQQLRGINNYQPVTGGPAGHNINDVLQFLPRQGTPADTLNIENDMGYTYN